MTSWVDLVGGFSKQHLSSHQLCKHLCNHLVSTRDLVLPIQGKEHLESENSSRSFCPKPILIIMKEA